MSTALLRFVQQNWLGLLILGALAFAFVFLRSPASRGGSTQELDALLADGAQGRRVLLGFLARFTRPLEEGQNTFTLD